MFKFIIVILVIVVILIILRAKSSQTNNIRSKDFRLIIISILVLGLLILIATSGRFILPQLPQFIKIGIPLLTKLIGI